MSGLGVRAAAVALVATAAVVWFAKTREAPPPRRTAESPVLPARAARVRVFYGRDATREALMRRRASEDAPADYGDRTLFSELAGAAGGDPPAWVETWIVNRSGAPLRLGAEPPAVELLDGRRFATREPAALLGRDASGQARMLAAAFDVRAAEPLGIQSARRVVHALPPGIPFDDLRRANWDGLELEQATASAEALDLWTADCGRPLHATLTDRRARVATVEEPATRPESRR